MSPEHLDEIVRRRMTNTGESYEEATVAVQAVLRMVQEDLDAEDGWVMAWTSERPSETVEREERTWIRGVPEDMRPLVGRFPPGSVVSAARSLLVPGPRRVALVVGYGRPRPQYPDGTVTVAPYPGSALRVECLPADLKIDGHRHGWTPARVAAVFAERP